MTWTHRGSRPEVFCKKGVEENTCVRVSFSIKLQTWRFPVNFEKFLRTPFLQNTSGRLLVELSFMKSFLLSSVSLHYIYSEVK